jgi:hypothetical protein
MGFRIFSRIRVLAVSLAAVTATTTLFAIAGAAGPAAAATSNGCPASKTVGSLPTASNVGASFSNNGNITTYEFSSLTNENPVGGVPGLIKYCVYPSQVSQPTTINVSAFGDNGVKWLSAKGSNNFAFVRPGGDKSNIGLDGTTTTMGTATWSTLPGSQTIILHINDPTVCQQLYPGSTTGTCFVKPSTGPVCDQGDTSVAYNAMPFDVVNCLNPGVAFEANGWNEFGDSVTLSGTSGRTLKSLIVDFQSFACVTGTWDNQSGNTPCGGGTTAGVSPGTFTWPITANIYAADSSGLPTGPPLATTGPVDEQIPFRPNADTTGNCTGSVANKWWNPDAIGGGACQNSIATKLTFDSFTAPGGGPVGPLPNEVVWTVAFNTSTSGYQPQGDTTPTCTLTAGIATAVCPLNPADSLNVGDHSLPNAPYAGTSLFDTNGDAVGSKSPQSAGLSFIPPDDNGRPLGEIITTTP